MMVFINAVAQMPAAITISPSNATAADQITITIDPSQACFESGSLAGAPSVAMHSGVTLIDETNWNYVVEFNSTGADGQNPVFTSNGDGTYSFTFVPNDFYDIPAGTIVTRICAVFNNGTDWTTDGRDYDNTGAACQDFFIPINYVSSEPSLFFKVNMNKQIADGNFDSAIGTVYAIIQGMDSIVLENTFDINFNPLNIYIGELSGGLLEGQVIDFHFRMDVTNETVNRSVTLNLGTNAVEVWFNDESLATLTLNCDMQYYAAEGWFTPSSQYLDVAGSFNGWDGTDSHLEDLDGDLNYTLVLTGVDPGLIEFKFRIDGDWNNSEFPGGGPNRVILVPPGDFSYNAIYSNYMPGAVPVTFICHMDYQIAIGAFDPAVDYLDAAGSFNGWGGGNQLADFDGDLAYTMTWPVDISSTTTMEYKFRMNGDWNTSEFPGGGPNRTFTVQDTTGGFENIIDVWYNNEDPSVGAKPQATNAAIIGNWSIGTELSASYDYVDVNSDPEGATTFKWSVADDDSGTNMTVLSDGTNSTYTLVAADAGKYIFLDIRPVAATESGSNSAGTMYGDTIRLFIGPIWALGINTPSGENISFYPNPVSNNLFIDNMSNLNEVVIYNILGQPIKTVDVRNTEKVEINTSSLNSGIYIIIVKNDNGIVRSEKLLKN